MLNWLKFNWIKFFKMIQHLLQGLGKTPKNPIRSKKLIRYDDYFFLIYKIALIFIVDFYYPKMQICFEPNGVYILILIY